MGRRTAVSDRACCRTVRFGGEQDRRLRRIAQAVRCVPPHPKSAVVVELVQAIDDLDPTLGPKLLAPDEWPYPVPLRLLVYQSIHSEELCDGGADGPRGCTDANDATCGECGIRRTVDDANAPGAYPQCSSCQFAVNR